MAQVLSLIITWTSSWQFYFADVKRYQERLRQKQDEGAFDFPRPTTTTTTTVVENASDLSRLSEFEIDGGGNAPAFSTPVRASFRQRRGGGMIRSAIETAR